MADNKDYLTFSKENGQIKISEEVIVAISCNAVVEIDGVSGLYTSYAQDIAEFLGNKGASKGVTVKIGEDGIELDVFIVAKYGYSIPTIGKQIQNAVKSAVESTTGAAVSVVNVHVCGIAEDK